MKYILIICFSLILFGCKNSNIKENSSSNTQSKLSQGLSQHQAMIYTLPSPYQISSFLQILNIKYDNSLIENNVNSNIVYPSPINKALNLGINYVDIYYSFIYDKYPNSYSLLNKVEDLMYELGLKSKKDYELINRIEKNFNSKDSLNNFIKIYQKDFEDYYEITTEKQITFVIVSGIYIEGLYLLTNIYDNNCKNKSMTSFMDASLKKVFFQQAIFLENLIELINSYNDERLNILSIQLNDLQKIFNSAKITYKMQDNNIESVNFNKKYIRLIKEKITEIRNKIITDKL